MENNEDRNAVGKYAEFLKALRQKRRDAKTSRAKGSIARQRLTPSQRRYVLEATGKRCHICGGKIEGKDWQADHVLAHSTGGLHSLDNYLPAHALCNNYRWDYSAEEFQHILKLGVWIRTQIEHRTVVGQLAARRFLVHEVARQKRRKAR